MFGPSGVLDRAHAAVMRRVDVAHLDRRALAREAAGAERRQAAAVREARERVRLVHELRQLRGAEELLQRGHDRADVDDRLRRDRVGVLGREALAHDPLHAVEADPERLLDQLADGAQAAVAEVLVLVEVVGDRLAREADGLGRVVSDLDLGLLRHAEQSRQRHELLDERDDVVVRQRARFEIDVEMQAAVELVAPDAGQVIPLGVEEQLVQERSRGVDRRRLARALLLEQLDQRALLGPRDLGVRLDRVADVVGVPEQSEDLLVGGVPHRPQQHRDRQLALAVDADVDLALLVDLELEPGAAGRHQVRDEDLLLTVLRLHQVGARRAHELRDDDALGAVDDEGAALGHPREVAHEDRLLADLAGLAVDEGDRDGQRTRVREVLLAALVQGRDRLVEGELAELDGEVAGVVLDRRDVVDRLAQATVLRVGEPGEGLLLDVDQVGDIKGLGKAREATARPGGVNRCQDGDSSSGGERAERRRESATSKDSTRHRCPVRGAVSAHGPRPGSSRMWRGLRPVGRLRLSADRRIVPASGHFGHPPTGARSDRGAGRKQMHEGPALRPALLKMHRLE